jgi:hypothetical protein
MQNKITLNALEVATRVLKKAEAKARKASAKEMVALHERKVAEAAHMDAYKAFLAALIANKGNI